MDKDVVAARRAGSWVRENGDGADDDDDDDDDDDGDDGGENTPNSTTESDSCDEHPTNGASSDQATTALRPSASRSAEANCLNEIVDRGCRSTPSCTELEGFQESGWGRFKKQTICSDISFARLTRQVTGSFPPTQRNHSHDARLACCYKTKEGMKEESLMSLPSRAA